MIDRYIDTGDMFALYDSDLKAVCIVNHIEDDICELKNITVYKQFQRKGYGTIFINYIFDNYKNRYKTMLVGTGEAPLILQFYKNCGFEYAYRIKGFFTDN